MVKWRIILCMNARRTFRMCPGLMLSAYSLFSFDMALSTPGSPLNLLHVLQAGCSAHVGAHLPASHEKHQAQPSRMHGEDAKFSSR